MTKPAPITVDEAEVTRRWAVRRSSLLDSVPLISPHLQKPKHLEPLARVLRRMHKAACGEGAPVFACLSAPPQLGKTELVQHTLAWWLARNPNHFLGYISYGSDIAETKSRRVRDLAKSIGVELRTDSRAVDLWNTTAGGGLLARGIQAGITGHSALSAVVIDDPYRNRVEAESRHYRERIDDDFRSTIWTRRHPRTSILVLHTRWHVEDLTGSLEKQGWETYVIPAINDVGEPLWPESGRDLEFWKKTREGAGEYAWWSMYMGKPRPREGRLFKGVTLHDEVPPAEQPMRYAIGLDLAYSTKKTSDYSAIVVVGMSPTKRAYVLRVVRKQCTAPELLVELKAIKKAYPGAPIHAYVGGTERGSLDFFEREGVHVKAEAAHVDKYSRAQGTAAAWNAQPSLVSVQRDTPWTEAFTSEVLDFSGQGDKHDDQVDALVAAYDALAVSGGSGVYLPSKPSTVARDDMPRGIGSPFR